MLNRWLFYQLRINHCLRWHIGCLAFQSQHNILFRNSLFWNLKFRRFTPRTLALIWMPTSRSEFQGFAPIASILQANFCSRSHRRAIAIASTSPTVYLSNPFEGDINNGLTSGQKFYTLATADRKKEELLSVAQENVTSIMSAFHHDIKQFWMGIPHQQHSCER